MTGFNSQVTSDKAAALESDLRPILSLKKKKKVSHEPPSLARPTWLQQVSN